MTVPVAANVSRETSEKLAQFARLVEKWTVKINLISKPSIPHIWDRHIEDSVQLYEHATVSGHWVDLGSGGGFPAIVLALMSQQDGRPTKFTMVESDQRKCVFLRTALRELDIKANVINDRIENIPALDADVLSARALADLTSLIGFADLHLNKAGMALFPKGQNWQAEDVEARTTWRYSCTPIRSQTNPLAAILKIKEITHV